MKMRSWSESNGAMLVPSTFTGWYKNTMMTRARPMAIKRSRDQLRISFRKECVVQGLSARTFAGKMLCDARSAATARDGLGAGFSGDAATGSAFSSVFSIFALPRIYNMFFTARARIDFHTGTGQTYSAGFLTASCVIRSVRQTVASAGATRSKFGSRVVHRRENLRVATLRFPGERLIERGRSRRA